MLPAITTYLKDLFETKIKEATEGEYLKEITTVFDGEPASYDIASIPAIVIESVDSAMQKKNQYYEATWRIKISIIVPSNKFYWSENYSIVDHKKYVQELMEGKGANSCSRSNWSISGILDNIQCIVVDQCTLANDLYIESVQYSNVSGQGFAGYRADMTIRLFNMQIQRV